MTNSQNRQGQADRVAEFEKQIEELRGVSVNPPYRRWITPWADLPEAIKLYRIVWESWGLRDGSSAPGVAVLQAIERHVDYAGLLPVQREMLQDLRARVDGGQLDEPLPGHKDRVGMALARIVGVGQFEERLTSLAEDADRSRAEVPERVKVRMMVDLALEASPPGAYTLTAIEREVDYDRLPPWRREALEGLRARVDQGELHGENPNPHYQGDRAELALRLAELDARIEDAKQFGAMDTGGRRWVWQELSEEDKLDRIDWEIRQLHLESESTAYHVIGREVDMQGVAEDLRREFESDRKGRCAVPTGEQIEHVMEDLGSVVRARYIEDDNDIYKFVPQEATVVGSMFVLHPVPEGLKAFSDLDYAQKSDLLEFYVDWEGFSLSQQSDIIGRVVGCDPPDMWMNGLQMQDDEHPAVDHSMPTAREMKLLTEEIRQDEHAARVRDYGEADAATYEQRVRDGAATVRHLDPDPPHPDDWMAKLTIDDQSRKELAAELKGIKRDTYVELEEQVAGWNYRRGEGGIPFPELPVTDREVLVEDYVDWGKYMERGLTFEDQARVMHEAARDPFPRESPAKRVTAPEQSSCERQLEQAAGAASDRGKEAGKGRGR